MERIDRLAAARGLQCHRRLSCAMEMERSAAARGHGGGSRATPSSSNSNAPPTGRLHKLHARHADRQRTPIEVPLGVSLFTAAEQAGVRVPTSCITQGKCKECIVEIARGMELLSPPTDCEKHLDLRGSRFRLSCQCRVAADAGEIECHTMRRGQMRIERHALHLPVTHKSTVLDPAVLRNGERIVDATSGRRSRGPPDPFTAWRSISAPRPSSSVSWISRLASSWRTHRSRIRSASADRTSCPEFTTTPNILAGF